MTNFHKPLKFSQKFSQLWLSLGWFWILDFEDLFESLLHFIFININYVIHCRIKRDNHQVPKIVRVPGNKTNPKKRKEKFTNNATNYCNKYRIYWFITLFENFLFSLKKQFTKSFGRKNVFNSCIENMCIGICIKWISVKKKSYYQNRLNRGLGDCYQCFLWCSGEYVFQWYTWDSEEHSVNLIEYPKHNYKSGLRNTENYIWICAPVSDLDQTTFLW